MSDWQRSRPDGSTRREFLAASGLALGTAGWGPFWPDLVAAASRAGRLAARGLRPALEFFTAREAADIDAVSAQLVPGGDTPGAREAGVVHFMDRALATFFARYGDAVRAELGAIRDAAAEDHGGRSFADLTADEQRRVLQRVGVTAGSQIRFLTLCGLFANPSYGGNRGGVGWTLIGFEDRFAFQPPFGHYDRGHHEQG